MRLAATLSALLGLAFASLAVAEEVVIVEDAELKVPAHPGGWTGNINVYLGAKALDRTDWKPVQGQVAFGLQFDFGHSSWPVNLAANLMYGVSLHEDASTKVRTGVGIGELQLGVRKIWHSDGHFNFALGGGFELVGAYEQIDTGVGTPDVHDSGAGVGVWASGSCYWSIGGHFNFGPQMTLSSAKLSVFGKEVNAGGLNVGLLAGFHW